jgi:putative flippase GtrA
VTGRLPVHVRQLLHFSLGSGLGLAVDLALFALGVHLGLQPWVANSISAASAVLVVYFFVTKYAFAGGRSASRFVLFVGWYVVSVLGFSVLIDLLHEATGWAPFVCKLVSLPPSFAANFAASKFLFGRARGASGGPDAAAPPAFREDAAA